LGISVAEMSQTIRAELGAAAEVVNSYRTRIAALIESAGVNQEDLVSAMYEAERALVSAQRLLVRAEKLAR